MILRAMIREQRPDWTILEAESGDACLAHPEFSVADAFSLDFNMPGMTGVELGERIRMHSRSVPVLITTANIQVTVQDAAKANGFGFIMKPLTADRVTELVTSIEDMLGMGQSRAS